MAYKTNGRSPNNVEFGSQQDQGRRKNMEDRLRVENISTAGGLNLTLAMIADGIGGNVFGERAAELAIEVTFQELIQSSLADPKHLPILLQRALHSANDVVYEEARRDRSKRGMGSTATVLAICQDQLYLANVGDSRAYLIRDDEVIQITQDHTWGQEMLGQGLITPDQLIKHPKAEELARSIGYDADVDVDLGIYLNGEGAEQEAIENQGLPLGPNDRLLLCSDGLIKSRHDGQGNYVELREIGQVVTHRVPQAAAADLVSRAIKRQADDNVSVIVLEMPGSKRGFYLPPIVLYAGGAVLAILLAILLIYFISSNFGGGENVQAEAAGPLPTETATVGPLVTEVGASGGNSTSAPLEFVQVITAGAGATWQGVDSEKTVSDGDSLPITAAGPPLTYSTSSNPAQFMFPDRSQMWVGTDTRLKMEMEAGDHQLVVILDEGTLLIQTTEPIKIKNNYGAEIYVTDSPALIGAFFSTSDPYRFEMHCLSAPSCSVIGEKSGQHTLSTEQMSIVEGDGHAQSPQPVAYERFVGMNVPLPTPTATPAATETLIPTNTPTATTTRIPATSTPTPVPDSDGDGVLDPLDRCQFVPGDRNNFGCPIPTTEPPRQEGGGGGGSDNGGDSGDGGDSGGGGDPDRD